MKKILRKLGMDYLTIIISREEVEKCDTSSSQNSLEMLLVDKSTIMQFEGSVQILFHGYDEDQREIYEIKEIRRFLKKLDSVFPYWYFFLDRNSDLLIMFTLCLVNLKKQRNGKFSANPLELNKFMGDHFKAMNKIFDKFGLEEDLNKKISKQVSLIYQNAQVGFIKE